MNMDLYYPARRRKGDEVSRWFKRLFNGQPSLTSSDLDDIMATSLLRIAVVQFAPKIGEVHANILKARELCRGLAPRSVDLVCFPEMIFSGYMFPDAPSIAPYLEHPKTGPTSTFCAELARNLQCYVVAGFPERLDPSSFPAFPNPASPSTALPHDPSASLVGANSALLYDPNGHLLHTYHKSNLFPTDVPWARPGTGFCALDLPLPLGRIMIAICNDLNVHENGQWISMVGGPYELAEWCQKEAVRTVLLLNAWLRPEEVGMKGGASAIAGGLVQGEGGSDSGEAVVEEEDENGDPLEPNWSVLNFWSMRLRPLWAKDVVTKDADPQGSARGSEKSAGEMQAKECVVVVSNRFGHERGKTFAGSSAMFSMCPGSGRPRLLHFMGEREEGVRIWATKIGT